MTSQSPLATNDKRGEGARVDDEHRVLKFRPRNTSQRPLRPDQIGHASRDVLFEKRDPIETASSILQNEAGPANASESDEFRHRMLSNLAALGFTAALTAFGIWLAISISDMRKAQDCVLMGRRDCAHISTPAS